jgi:hypothetical protein
MRKVWITVLSMWLVWAGCGASNAQQAKKAQPAKPAQTQSDSGPSLQETLDFLNNTFIAGIRMDERQTCKGSYNPSSYMNTWTMGWNSVYSLQTDKFPILSVTETANSLDDDHKPITNTNTGSLDLRRIDPVQVHVRKDESHDSGDGVTCSPHVTTFVIVLQGTDNQQIYTPLSGGSGSPSFGISLSDEALANRVANALKRAVQFAGGKPSAF